MLNCTIFPDSVVPSDQGFTCHADLFLTSVPGMIYLTAPKRPEFLPHRDITRMNGGTHEKIMAHWGGTFCIGCGGRLDSDVPPAAGLFREVSGTADQFLP
jgi:hypothetical protein